MLHQADKERYWESVEQALDVLAFPRNVARELRRELDALPPPTQELFYHAEPLDVAKDLAGRAECSQVQVHEYLKKVQRSSSFER